MSISAMGVEGFFAGRFLRLWMRRMARRMRARKARTPMTMPAIAPPASVLWWALEEYLVPFVEELDVDVGRMEGKARTSGKRESSKTHWETLKVLLL